MPGEVRSKEEFYLMYLIIIPFTFTFLLLSDELNTNKS
jgi:hypothetical protein